MCLILLSWKSHLRYPVVVAANRDEFYSRPSVAAHFWKDAPAILAGRDLRQGGSWLGLNHDGRFAAITNFRGGQSADAGGRSRGELIANYLRGDSSPSEFLQQLERFKRRYNPFNLLLGNRDELLYTDDEHSGWRRLPPGVYALGNDRLGHGSRKERNGISELRQALHDGADLDQLLAILADSAPAENGEDSLHQKLSARFIQLPEIGYGTRASTVLRIANDGSTDFVERRFDEAGNADDSPRFRLTVGNSTFS